MAQPIPEHLTQTVDIETPELVVVSYTIAGLGSRVYAALIDLLLCFALFLGSAFVIAMASRRDNDIGSPMSTAWAFAITAFFQFLVIWGYYLLAEGLFDGQTLGKRFLGIRAVRDGGYSVGFSASAVRNLMRLIDLQPLFSYAVGITSIAVTKSGKRLGDIVAGTIVVRETMVQQPALTAAPTTPTVDNTPLVARLDDQEFQLLEHWASRRSALEPERRKALTQQVSTRLAHAIGSDTRNPESARGLLDLLERERRARAQGAAARGATGASRQRYAIVATSSPRWIAFAAQLTEARRRGLDSLGEGGVRSFVAEYRALSADLARLRTAARGSSSNELFYLGRLVAGAHNLLYRDRRSTMRQILRFIAVSVPTEIRRSFRPILVAATFLFVPAIIAGVAVARNPAVAPVFIPVQMLDRAEEGVQRAKSEDGYIPDPEVFRPVMASRIISNNVQVTIATFAFGVTAGIVTILLLVLNGVSFGGVFGLYQSKGIATLLLAFVAPHGVLELSALCIGAAGGLLIAAAMLVPGNRTRRRALAENSARAMRLLAGASLMLVVAGSLEGMVSPIPYWPLSLKLIVSAITAVLLFAYLRSGVGSEEPAGLDLEIAIDDRRRHAAGADVEHGDAGLTHSRESLLSLAD
ncbi:MAG TPA: stage II sporulation protein M [Gemmatimonadaceae bacterium]|jgi:uncharacterized membrane protein SpoIIM required for sporulation/uncharacterized RDD family membrane protein YckC